MPIYEYKCECGNEFESLKGVEDRHNTTCECGNKAVLKISNSTFRMAHWFTSKTHDGQILSRRPTTDYTPMWASDGKEL